MPFGPQKSITFGNVSMFMKSDSYWPAPKRPSSAQAWITRTCVLEPPALLVPVPKRSMARSVFSMPASVGMKPLKLIEVCRMLKIVSPSLPQPGSPGQVTGIVEGRKVACHCGSTRLKSSIMSSCTLPLISRRAWSASAAALAG